MSRYIDMEWLLGVANLSNGVVDIDDMYNAPSIELVRCRECKYYNGKYCFNSNVTLPTTPDANDFCSYGEREVER